MTDTILTPKVTLTPRDVDLLRMARAGTLRQQRYGHDGGDVELDVACRELQQYGLLRADLGLTPDGEAVLARRDEPVTVPMTAEAARWLSRWLHEQHHELGGHDADLALSVRDAANLAAIRHDRPGITDDGLADLARSRLDGLDRGVM